MRDFAELLKHFGAVGASRLARRLSLALVLCLLAIPGAFAQSPYTPAWGATGLADRTPAVTIDLGALDALGPSPNVASDSLAHAAPRSPVAQERIAAAPPPRDTVHAARAPHRTAHAARTLRREAHHRRAQRHLAAREHHRAHVAATPARPRPPAAEPHRRAIAAAETPAARPVHASPKSPHRAAPTPVAQTPATQTPVARTPVAQAKAPLAKASAAQAPTAPAVAAAPTTPATPAVPVRVAKAHERNNPRDAAASLSDAGGQTGTTTVAALAAPIVPRASQDAAPVAADSAPKASFTAKMAAPAPAAIDAAPARSMAAAPVQIAAVTPPPPSTMPPVAIPVAAPAIAGAAAGTAIHFPPGGSDLAAASHSSLNSLVQRLAANPDLRVQLVAYATGSDDEANQARRLSLARAIAVRAYLIDQGVRGTRIDVRALGNRNAGNGPADRVDLVVLDR